MANNTSLFEARLARIRSDADEIASLMNTLSRCQLSPVSLNTLDLKMSARNLTEAAAKLDLIRAKLETVE